MIVRIVRMGFKKEEVDNFQNTFSRYSSQIAQAEGCAYLELWKDSEEPNVFFTHSHWDHESSLERYRESLLFKEIWGHVKPLFDRKPEAWTVYSVFKTNVEA